MDQMARYKQLTCPEEILLAPWQEATWGSQARQASTI
jgi:hypothetical protein